MNFITDLVKESGITTEIFQMKKQMEWVDLIENRSRNFNVISKIDNLSEEFMEAYLLDLNYDMISRHQCLSKNFIDKHPNVINNFELVKNHKVDLNIRLEIGKILTEEEWFSLSFAEDISEEFLRLFHDKISWGFISFKYINDFSDDFIRVFADKFNWNQLALYGNISMELIEENVYRINWNTLIHRTNVPMRLIECYQDFINECY